MTKDRLLTWPKREEACLREPYSAAAAPDWLLGRALCALPEAPTCKELMSWPEACGVRGRLPTATGDEMVAGGDE
jgi:hypothetical protein